MEQFKSFERRLTESKLQLKFGSFNISFKLKSLVRCMLPMCLTGIDLALGIVTKLLC